MHGRFLQVLESLATRRRISDCSKLEESKRLLIAKLVILVISVLRIAGDGYTVILVTYLKQFYRGASHVIELSNEFGSVSQCLEKF